jgi:transcription elongation factor Elf1
MREPYPLQSPPCERYTSHATLPISTQGVSQVPNPTVKEVETRLGTVQCAICKGSSFGIDERSMQADGEWRGICRKCYYTFHIYTDMEFYLRTQPDIPYRLKEMSCPTCNHKGVSLNFRATMSVRESIYFLTCTACQKTYPERSSLEAFE